MQQKLHLCLDKNIVYIEHWVKYKYSTLCNITLNYQLWIEYCIFICSILFFSEKKIILLLACVIKLNRKNIPKKLLPFLPTIYMLTRLNNKILYWSIIQKRGIFVLYFMLCIKHIYKLQVRPRDLVQFHIISNFKRICYFSQQDGAHKQNAWSEWLMQ